MVRTNRAYSKRSLGQERDPSYPGDIVSDVASSTVERMNSYPRHQRVYAVSSILIEASEELALYIRRAKVQYVFIGALRGAGLLFCLRDQSQIGFYSHVSNIISFDPFVNLVAGCHVFVRFHNQNMSSLSGIALFLPKRMPPIVRIISIMQQFIADSLRF